MADLASADGRFRWPPTSRSSWASWLPVGLKILLLSLAIVDDVVAVLIIAFVFTETITWIWLGWAAGTFVLVYAFQRIGVRPVGVYVVLGAFIWLAFVRSGVHPTVAGVLLGLSTPARLAGREAVSPLQRLEDALHPWDNPRRSGFAGRFRALRQDCQDAPSVPR